MRVRPTLKHSSNSANFSSFLVFRVPRGRGLEKLFFSGFSPRIGVGCISSFQCPHFSPLSSWFCVVACLGSWDSSSCFSWEEECGRFGLVIFFTPFFLATSASQSRPKLRPRTLGRKEASPTFKFPPSRWPPQPRAFFPETFPNIVVRPNGVFLDEMT